MVERLQRWELRLLERAATEAPVQVVPPFRAIPGPAGTRAGFDYALPVDPLDETIEPGIARLRRLYRAHHLPLRIEFNQSRWTGLASALERAGLLLASRNPIMVCEPPAFAPSPAAGVDVRFEAVDGRQPGRMRVTAELGGVVAGRASLGGIDGVAELYGVVTDPAFRRRGVATTLCSALVGWHFERGGTLVFLDADTDAAARLYGKLGFEQVDWRLTYVDE